MDSVNDFHGIYRDIYMETNENVIYINIYTSHTPGHLKKRRRRSVKKEKAKGLSLCQGWSTWWDLGGDDVGTESTTESTTGVLPEYYLGNHLPCLTILFYVLCFMYGVLSYIVYRILEIYLVTP